MDDLEVLEWDMLSPSYFKSRVDYATDGPYLECSQWVQSALQSVQKMSRTKHDSQKLVEILIQTAGISKFLNSQSGFEGGEGSQSLIKLGFFFHHAKHREEHHPKKINK